MKHTSAELKEMARNALTGKWGIVIGITVLEILFNLLLTAVTIPFSSAYTPLGVIIYLLATLIVGLISGLFSAGSTFFFLNICRGREYRLSNLFAAFKMHPDRFLIVSMILTAVQMVFEIPGLILTYTGSSLNSYFILLISSLCSIAGSIASLILSLFFMLSTYLLLDDPDLGAVASMKLSAKMMRGNKGRYFYISLSFIGWFILGMLSCGIGYLWVVPYISMTYACFYIDVLHQQDPADPPQSW